MGDSDSKWVDRRGQGTDRRGQARQGPERRDESAWEAVPLDAEAGLDADSAPHPLSSVERPAPDSPASVDGLAPSNVEGQTLVAAAVDARTRAHARYSGFKVGAAFETADGTVITGCNIENATYGLTLCAERVALVKALSDGHEVFTRIAVVADTADPTPPCGPCRQLLWEYCGDIEVVLANLERTTATLRLSQLLPMPFDGRLLE